MRQKKSIPRYQHGKNALGQITNSSKRKGQSSLKFTIKRLKNHVLQLLALYCPINSWRVKLHRWRGVNIGSNVMIGLNCVLDHSYPEYIYLNDDCSLTGEVFILTHTNPSTTKSEVFESYVAPVIIGKRVWVGLRSTILPGVTIGEDSVVSAGSVISRNIPPKTLEAPAKNRRIKLI